MGFEYRIVTNLSNSQVEAIVMLLRTNHLFNNSKVISNYYELSFGNDENSIPKFTITVSTMCVEVTRYDKPKLWQDLHELEKYLTEQLIPYEIEEDF